jgi:phospholipid/cholesterol/gamma-HCH transport system substrate-binding protein
VLAVLVVGFLMFGGHSDYTVSATFENAGQLVKGNYVEVAGRPVGKIKSIELDDNARAKVKMSVGSGFDPLHEGTSAVIRAGSLSGIANRYIELHPGPNSGAKIADGGQIDSDKTQAPVDLDQLFNTLDPKTRKGLQELVQGSAQQYFGKSAKANEAIKYFNPALSTTSRVERELVLDRASFQRFVHETATTVSAIDERRDALAALVGSANTTAKAIGDENVALARALGLLPSTLRRADTTFVNLRATLDDLDVLVNESKPATKDLAKLFSELRPLVQDARPTIHDLSVLIRKQGANNDLIDLTRKMPQLASIADKTFPDDIEALTKTLPVISYIRPYTPDLAGWITKFGEAGNPYDANGHYARVQPIFNQFQYTDTPAGPTLVPLDNTVAGRNGLNARNSLRCPGAAMQPPPDGSAPWRGDDGTLECDPSNVPPGP